MIFAQADLFGEPVSDSSEAEIRHFGRMDGITGMPRLNLYRAKLSGVYASAYDDGYRAAIAELHAKSSAT